MNDTTVLKVVLKGLEEGYKGTDIHINKDVFTIGRRFDSDFRLDDPSVSSSHARITKKSGSYFIEDLDSSNGTFVNDTRISNSPLRTNDVIAFNKIRFRFFNPLEVERTEIADGAAFRESMKSSIKELEEEVTHLTADISPEREQSAEPSKYKIRAKGRPFSGALMSLFTTLLFSVGLLFIFRLFQLPDLGWDSMWAALKGQLAGFPFFHSHLYWTLAVVFNLLYILIGICAPLGMALGGMVMQRYGRGKRLKNALIFSIVYTVFGFLLQFAGLGFNRGDWAGINSGSNFGLFTGGGMNIAVTLVYFWLAALAFSFLGTLLAEE